jgi:hypothetical protein
MSLTNVQSGITVEGIAEKISSEVAAEIARVENYLNSLRKLQAVLDPPPRKRKYTKRKKALSPNLAQYTDEILPKVIPLIAKEGYYSPPKGYMTSYEFTGIRNTKKNRSRNKAV